MNIRGSLRNSNNEDQPIDLFKRLFLEMLCTMEFLALVSRGIFTFEIDRTKSTTLNKESEREKKYNNMETKRMIKWSSQFS